MSHQPREARKSIGGETAPQSFEKIVLVTRKTRLEELVERFNTFDQARFYIERSGANFSDYAAEHDTYQAALRVVRDSLSSLAKLHPIDRGFLPNYLFTPKDMVVVAGQDGLVVNTAKYLDGQPIIAVNPDPARFDGVLLPYKPEQAVLAARQVMSGRALFKNITMAQAELADGQKLLAFNDLFIGARSHISARYSLEFSGRKEIHSSSGIIVSTGAGSSGWLSSLYNMAQGMAPLFQSAGHAEEARPARADPRFPWDADKLMFVVREPFTSRASQAGIVAGEISKDRKLKLESRMADQGVIFSDGVESDYLSFNAGTLATIQIADRKTKLAVPR
jgi:NAD kinase